MLTKSPMLDVEIADLGVSFSEELRTGEKDEQRANVAIYLSLLFTLHHGRRDLMPLVWVWAKSMHDRFPKDWKPDIDMERHTATPKWVGQLFQDITDNILEYRIDTIVNPSNEFRKHETDDVVILQWLDKMATWSIKNHEENGDDALQYLFEGAEVPVEAQAVINFVGERVGVCANIASLCQAVSIANADDDNEAKEANTLLAGAQQTIISTFGVEYAPYANKIVEAFDQLEDRESMIDVWDALVDSLFPQQNIEIAFPAEFDDAVQRMQYRWRNGIIESDLAVSRDRAFAMKAKLAGTQLKRSMGQQFSAASINTALTWAEQQVQTRLKTFVPITFMRVDAYERFKRSELTANVYELHEDGEQTWHENFSDNPLVCRRVTDKRLWGEEGDPLTYGVLMDPTDVGRMNALRDMYGPVAVQWKRSALDFATITLNDSQSAPYALPAVKGVLQKFLMTFFLAEEGLKTGKMNASKPGIIPWAAKAFTGYTVPWINFIEVQLHDSMSLSDVEKIYIPDGLPLPD